MATPFSSVYATLFTTLSGSAEVTAIAPAGNMVRHDTEYPALIDHRQVGDLPCLELLPDPSAGRNLHATSDSAEIDMLFSLVYRTGEEKLAATLGLWNLDWAVLRALYTAGVTLGNEYITQWNITAWEPIAPLEPGFGPGQNDEQGWESSMQILVSTSIPHSELLVT